MQMPPFKKQEKDHRAITVAFRTIRLFLVLCFLCFIVVQCSFDAQADSLSVGIDVHDLCGDFLTQAQLVGNVLNSLVCDFRNVNQSVQTCFQFNKSTILFDLYNLTGDDSTDLVFRTNLRPWFRCCLLQTQRNLTLLFVEGQNLNIDDVSDVQNFLRVLQLAPRNFRNVQQTMWLRLRFLLYNCPATR